MATTVTPATNDRPVSDLNMTPLIDVLLVLLVMFILTMPLNTHAVRIDLPVGQRQGPLAPDPVRNHITINAAGVIAWNGTAVDRATLRRLLAEAKAMPVAPVIDLKPVAEARYAVVDAVMADIKRSGVETLSLPGNEAYGRF